MYGTPKNVYGFAVRIMRITEHVSTKNNVRFALSDDTSMVRFAARFTLTWRSTNEDKHVSYDLQ